MFSMVVAGEVERFSAEGRKLLFEGRITRVPVDMLEWASKGRERLILTLTLFLTLIGHA